MFEAYAKIVSKLRNVRETVKKTGSYAETEREVSKMRTLTASSCFLVGIKHTELAT